MNGKISLDTNIVIRLFKNDPHLDPQLVWAGKKEHTSFEIPTVSLHIHKHIAPEAIIKRESLQPDLLVVWQNEGKF